MPNKTFAALAAFVLFVAFSTTAEARHHHRHTSHHTVKHYRVVKAITAPAGCVFDNNGRQLCRDGQWRTSEARIGNAYDGNSNIGERIVSHPEGCPRIKFCGCGVSVWVFGHSIRDLWPAAAYYRFPRDRIAPGNVAIFGRHHVAGIISDDGHGMATLYDPNSGGHQTRIHQRYIGNATVVNPHGAKIAQR